MESDHNVEEVSSAQKFTLNNSVTLTSEQRNAWQSGKENQHNYNYRMLLENCAYIKYHGYVHNAHSL